MDSTTINPVVEAGKPSRLPAGSTLEVFPGLHVPHPHAEVNLAGAGDPRLGDTKAVTEFTQFEVKSVDDDGKPKEVVVASLQQKALPDEVKPKTLTVNPDAKRVAAPESPAAATGAAAAADVAVAEEPSTTTVPR